MTSSARTFYRDVIVRQVLTGLGGHAAIALLAPTLLVLDRGTTNSVQLLGLELAALSLVITTLVSMLRLRKHRSGFIASTMNAPPIGASEIRSLVGLPSALTFRFFVVYSVVHACGLLPLVRP